MIAVGNMCSPVLHTLNSLWKNMQLQPEVDVKLFRQNIHSVCVAWLLLLENVASKVRKRITSQKCVNKLLWTVSRMKYQVTRTLILYAVKSSSGNQLLEKILMSASGNRSKVTCQLDSGFTCNLISCSTLALCNQATRDWNLKRSHWNSTEGNACPRPANIDIDTMTISISTFISYVWLTFALSNR